jgi:hypothetical protein
MEPTEWEVTPMYHGKNPKSYWKSVKGYGKTYKKIQTELYTQILSPYQPVEKNEFVF